MITKFNKINGEQDQVGLQERFFFHWNHVARLRKEFNCPPATLPHCRGPYRRIQQ